VECIIIVVLRNIIDYIMSLSSNISRENELAKRAKNLKVNAGTVPDADLGPVISKQVTS